MEPLLYPIRSGAAAGNHNRMDIFDKSAIVAAHPDDENLWFSSVLTKVDSIVLCFLEVAGMPEWTRGRRQSLAEYPLPNLTCLELDESEVFWGADWEHPGVTDYGLEIVRGDLSDTLYKDNFERLKQRLRERLDGCRNVFTHNPWGEYGHVEHVQVYRAVKALQQDMHFDLWFTAYVSNKSARLMSETLASRDLGRSVTLPTEKSLATGIAALYKRHGCWTWYDDYDWSDTDTFILDPEAPAGTPRYGTVAPLNFIRIEPAPPLSAPNRGLRSRLKAKLKKMLGTKG